MATKMAAVLVVRDEAGNLYVLTEELLAQARATDEQRAAIEAALEDVQGFITPIPIPSAQPISFEGGGGLGYPLQYSALRLVLPSTLPKVRPAIGPFPRA